MKRSEINGIIDGAIAFCRERNFLLPPFAYWTPEQFRSAGAEYREIFDNKLGWDVTDFGSGDFGRAGLTLLTVRNGKRGSSAYPKPYAEKLLIVEEGQVTPYHYHALKTEDIINRGGGNLIVKLYNSASETQTAKTAVTVHMDGRSFKAAAGEQVRVRRARASHCRRRCFILWGPRKTVGNSLWARSTTIGPTTIF